jgi:hypothetical protein
MVTSQQIVTRDVEEEGAPEANQQPTNTQSDSNFPRPPSDALSTSGATLPHIPADVVIDRFPIRVRGVGKPVPNPDVITVPEHYIGAVNNVEDRLIEYGNAHNAECTETSALLPPSLRDYLQAVAANGLIKVVTSDVPGLRLRY